MAFRVIQGGEIRVNTTTDGTQYEQSIAALDDGGWIVTWRDSAKEGTGNGRGIFQQRYAANGERVGEETHVNTTTTAGHQEAPQATALPDGGWVVTWMSDHDGDGNYQIYQQRYDKNSGEVGGEILVSGALPGSQDYPVVTALKDEHAGGWVVSWLSGDINDTTIYQRRYDSSGNPATDAIAIPATTEPGFHLSVNTAALPDGGWIATWTGGGIDGGAIIHQRFNADGTARGNPTTIGGSRLQYPSVTILKDGGWVIAWSDFEGTTWAVKQQRFLPDGTALEIEKINISKVGSHINPDLQALPDGGWIVTWNADRVDSSQEAILQQRYDKDGSKVGGQTMVNTTEAGRQFGPAVTLLKDGSWVIAWWSALNPSGAATGADIYQQRTSGEFLTVSVDTATGTHDDETLFATLGSLNAGDELYAGGGEDTLLMVEAGSIDLTAPAIFAGFESSRDRMATTPSSSVLAGFPDSRPSTGKVA